MTPLSEVNKAFLNLIESPEWNSFVIEEARADWLQILKAAAPWFKFPRVDITIDEENHCFVGDLTNEEIQILAHLMKCEWLVRSIHSYENLHQTYTERDFSQANMLAKLTADLAAERLDAKYLEAAYYRSPNHKSYPYSQLAGGKNK